MDKANAPDAKGQRVQAEKQVHGHVIIIWLLILVRRLLEFDRLHAYDYESHYRREVLPTGEVFSAGF